MVFNFIDTFYWLGLCPVTLTPCIEPEGLGIIKRDATGISNL